MSPSLNSLAQNTNGTAKNEQVCSIMDTSGYQSFSSEACCVSYLSMKRSCRVLREFVLYYFPLYHLEVQDFFRFYPILGFMEALVYETDEEVEAMQAGHFISLGYSPWQTKQAVILDVLKQSNFKHHCVENYLEQLGEYFELETQLLAARQVKHQDVIKAAELRSSDYRFLHCTLQKMLGQNFQEEEFNQELKLMWPLEVLNDIEDDIEFYQDDVGKQCYNTYRMFVKMYGEKAPYYLQKELDYYENLFHEGVESLSKTSFKYKAFQESWKAYRLDHPVPIIPQPILEN
jgi:hypothetical protein